MNTYFVMPNDDPYNNEIEVITADSLEDAAMQYIENHYMEDEYGETVVVYEPKIKSATYEIAEPELKLNKVPNKRENK